MFDTMCFKAAPPKLVAVFSRIIALENQIMYMKKLMEGFLPLPPPASQLPQLPQLLFRVWGLLGPLHKLVYSNSHNSHTFETILRFFEEQPLSVFALRKLCSV